MPGTVVVNAVVILVTMSPDLFGVAQALFDLIGIVTPAFPKSSLQLLQWRKEQDAYSLGPAFLCLADGTQINEGQDRLTSSLGQFDGGARQAVTHAEFKMSPGGELPRGFELLESFRSDKVVVQV